jgi:hypothetical protein
MTKNKKTPLNQNFSDKQYFDIKKNKKQTQQIPFPHDITKTQLLFNTNDKTKKHRIIKIIKITTIFQIKTSCKRNKYTSHTDTITFNTDDKKQKKQKKQSRDQNL